MNLNENTLALLYALDDGLPHSQKQVCEDWLIPKTTINTITRELVEQSYVTLVSTGHRREKHIFTASLPGAAGMLASALYQLLDGIFVGQLLGETPFAALNLAMPFVIINFALADLIGVGSSVPISICLGQKKEQEANNLFTCSCLMIVLSGIFVGMLLYASAPALIGLMGADGDFARFAVEYLRVYAICSPVTTIVFAADNYLRICGWIKYSMFVNIFMSVISAVLELSFLPSPM